MKKRQRKSAALHYTMLVILSIVWIFPIVWIILTSFRGEGGGHLFPILSLKSSR